MRYMNSFPLPRSSLNSPISRNALASTAPINLGYWTCYFIDLPEDQHLAKIQSPVEDNTMYSCFFKTRYLLGDNVGPSICITLCALISIIGVFGVIANIMNILVLRQSSKESSLQKLLVLLAGFDLVACLFAVLTSAMLQVILDNVNRSKGALIAFKVVFLLYSLGRTGSVFITILVAIERYFVVVHPFATRAWLTSRRLVVITATWLLLIFLINFPWWINTITVSQNLKAVSNGPLAKYPAIFVSTKFGSQIYNLWLRPIHTFIDFVLPLPLLLLFNGLLYSFIYKWNQSRKTLTGSQVREVNAAKMFSIVALTLFVCHAFAVVDYIVVEVTGKVYRELLLSIMLAVTLNAAINFFVYYTFGQDFRQYFWLLVGSKFTQKRNNDDDSSSCKNRSSSMNIFERSRSMLGKVSFGGGDVILHESIRYTKTFESDEKNEESKLLAGVKD